MPNKILYKDCVNHKVLLCSDDTVTYERFPNIKYKRLTGVQAAERILLEQELEHCYIESLSRSDFKQAYHNLRKMGRKIGDAFNPKGRAQLTVGNQRIQYEGMVLNCALVCSNCIVGSCDLSDVFLGSRIDFHGTVFIGLSCFSGAIFAGSAWFWDVEFGSCADFIDAKFASSATFYNGRFLYDADFMGANFASEADFTGAKFFSDAEFWNARFQDTADFRKARFLMPVSFKDANFYSRVNFQDACFLILELSAASFDKTCYMQNIAAGKIDFNGAAFRENLLLSAVDGVGWWLREIEANMKRAKEGLMKKSTAKSGIEVEMILRRYLEERLEGFRERLLIWRDSGRGICSVNFGGTVIQGELVCDFKHLEPMKGGSGLCAVLEPHHAGEWEEARRQYAWLGERYRRRGAYNDREKALWWAADCAHRAERQRLFRS